MLITGGSQRFHQPIQLHPQALTSTRSPAPRDGPIERGCGLVHVGRGVHGQAGRAGRLGDPAPRSPTASNPSTMPAARTPISRWSRSSSGPSSSMSPSTA